MASATAELKSAAAAAADAATSFDQKKLHHVEPEVKNPIPDADVIAVEAQINKHDSATEELQKFRTGSLKAVETVDKSILPDKEAIEQEKKEVDQRRSICEFDQAQLKHAETAEKNPLPTLADIESEKKAAAAS